jgi:hypothetical protein
MLRRLVSITLGPFSFRISTVLFLGSAQIDANNSVPFSAKSECHDVLNLVHNNTLMIHNFRFELANFLGISSVFVISTMLEWSK